MAEEVYMDIPQVQTMAQNFGTYGEVLQQVSKAVAAALILLTVSGLVSIPIVGEIEAALGILKPRIDNMAQKLIELRGDIGSAINNYQTGDVTGSSHFLPGH